GQARGAGRVIAEKMNHEGHEGHEEMRLKKTRSSFPSLFHCVLRVPLLLLVIFANLAQAKEARRSSSYERGVTLFWQGKVEEAILHYRKALQREPKNAALLTDLGLALGKLGQVKEAEARFRQAIEIDARRWYAYGN